MQFIEYDSLEQLPDNSAALFEWSRKQSLFMSREWFAILSDLTLENDQSLSLAGVEHESRLLALLPLLKDPESPGQRQSFRHRYSALFGLLTEPKLPDTAWSCLAQGLSHLAPQSLQLWPVAGHDPALLKLGDALRVLDYEAHWHHDFYNWFHRTHSTSFDDYLAARPSRLRNTLARKQRKLTREHTHEPRLFTGHEVEQGLKDYHAAYSASWKAHEQYPELLDALAIRLAKPGWTRLGVLYIDGQAAAAQLWFVVHGKASIFRLAYQQQWQSFSPGSILTAWLMQHVMEQDKVEEIDFLTGNEAYKQDWMSERRSRYRLLFVRHNTETSRMRRWVSRINGIVRRG